MVFGAGDRLTLKILYKFKLNFQKCNWVLLILLSGPSPVLVCLLVQIRGTTSELREFVSTGGLWFDTLTQSLSRLLFFGWCLRINLQLEIECLHGGMRATLLVYFARMVQRVEITYFWVVGSVLAYGELVWNGVIY
jgi:hypothetical protein